LYIHNISLASDSIFSRLKFASDKLLLVSFLRPGRSADYYDERVCLSVCLSLSSWVGLTVRTYVSGTAVQTSANFLHMLCCLWP